ncbi:butyrophilin-like protein 3 isoform X2 [Alosa sapidissima]|uniref:butyrophilin-like protein 3 isoform X2 n=1 Tax=Alosa sapidissima TaxID=34773 RepID=UPI001C09B58E|nr:butyrophilin-like protein 3 isoform X2 [Alosa sapidissima]
MMPLTWMTLCLIPLTAVVTLAAVTPDPELFILTGSEGPVSAPEGSSVTMPCGLSPSSSAVPLQVRWHRPNAFRTPVLLYDNRRVQGEPADPRYRGRVSLVGELEKGNVSLRLENLTLEDMGDYVCYAKSIKWYNEFSIRLKVRVQGNTPVVSSTEGGAGQVIVTCESDGWSPEPTVTWRDRKGTEIHQNYSNIHFLKDEGGLVAVSSWLLYSPSEAEWLSCAVGLSDQERRESRVALRTTTTHTPTHTNGAWKHTLTGVLFFILCGVVIWFAWQHRKDVVRLFSRQRKPTATAVPDETNAECNGYRPESGTNEEQTRSETSAAANEWTPLNAESNDVQSKDGLSPDLADSETNTQPDSTAVADATKQRGTTVITTSAGVIVIRIPDVNQSKKHYVNLTLDMKTVPSFLKVQDNKTGILCPDPLKVSATEMRFAHALCEQSFSSGKHYWEVQVHYTDFFGHLKARQSWYVGVCTNTAEQTHRVSLTPRNGFWVLQYEKGTGLFVNTEPPTPVPVSELFQYLGVFLDCDEHTLTFYNSDRNMCLCCLFVTPNKQLIPLISSGVRDKEPVKLRQIQ